MKFFNIKGNNSTSSFILKLILAIIGLILLIGAFIDNKLYLVSILITSLLLSTYLKKRKGTPRNYDELYKFEKLFVNLGLFVLDIYFCKNIYNRTRGQFIESLKSLSVKAYIILSISAISWIVFRVLTIYLEKNVKKPISASRLIYEVLLSILAFILMLYILPEIFLFKSIIW